MGEGQGLPTSQFSGPAAEEGSNEVTDITLQKPVINVVTVTKKETTGGVQGELNNKMEEKSGSMKAHETDVIKAGVMHEEVSEEVTTIDYVDTNMQVGPHVPKPKSTWVRLNQEAYGPGEKDSGQNKPVLGQNGPLALIFEIFSNRALFRK